MVVFTLFLSWNDYYAFGMTMPGRNGGVDYRYQFNGMETDNEISGSGNSYTTEFRQYDPRLGRWLIPDPLAFQAPGWTPYRTFFNNPIIFTDNNGLFETRKEARQYKKEHGIEGVIRKDSDGGFNVSNKYTGQEWHKGNQWERENGFTNDDGIVEGAIVFADKNKSSISSSESNNSNSHLYWWMQTSNSTLGLGATLLDGTLGKMKPNEQWRFTKNTLTPIMKKMPLPNVSSTNKVFKNVVKPTLKVAKSGARKIPGIGLVMMGTDIAVNGVKPSHILDATVMGVGTIPVFGWIVAGVYIIADGATYAITGKTIGDHLDEADFSNVKTSFDLDHPVYEVMPTYSPGGQKW